MNNRRTYMANVLSFALFAALFTGIAHASQRDVEDKDADGSHVLSLDARLDALRSLHIIDYINKGDIDSVCELLDMSLKNNAGLLGPEGLSGISSEDKRKNIEIYKKITRYFEGKNRCRPRSRED